jgi:3-deoxy-D-manno-octulosonate 8-phosphate phosphatase (KDO 8-P phosphatase)
LSLPGEELASRARRLEWLLLDVDGVLTPGGLYYSSSGESLLRFDVRDGLAVKLARLAGLKVGILSGRGNPAVRRRARELEIDEVILERSDKATAFAELLSDKNVAGEQVAAVGDDLHDLPVLQASGLSFAPADAVPEVLAAVDHVLSTPGGYGAVREMVELVLKARGEWEPLVDRFRSVGA